MYKHFRIEASKDFFIARYCEGDFANCRRKKRRDAGETVPEKMLPNGELLR
jgi:hypothetical protein